MRHALSDAEWSTIEPILPNKPRGARPSPRPPRGWDAVADKAYDCTALPPFPRF
jgi:transposase